MDLTEHPFVRKLLSLDLAPGDYVVAGSGPMLAHGLREAVGDLDVVARGAAWKTAVSLAEPVPAPSGHGRMVLLFGGCLEVFDRWLPGSAEPDELIEAAEFIQGIPFCPLREVAAWKGRSNRRKDREDLVLIQKFLNGNGRKGRQGD
ncbi:hypothetical protein GCM10010207_13570 [Streptomyces atratus]|uniref:hypothetical protein n=1 Tax=Streptomyces atratus TaxID=1893 RepID=UPI0016705FEC|nr:hypothetical protein [Streptomyces atratus]GGT15802.1 hypothetical protein GCM10010207_13570 [Streptomyces atratus]